MKKTTQSLTTEQQQQLIQTLKSRFQQHTNRHPHIDWAAVEKKLANNLIHLTSLFQMEETGGEPDVVAHDPATDTYTFMDCSAESPKGRRSICYDHEALESRKEHKPANSAINMAAEMGISMLTEEQYRFLQQLGAFDTKTSSWIMTPPPIRKLGGACFATDDTTPYLYTTMEPNHTTLPEDLEACCNSLNTQYGT